MCVEKRGPLPHSVASRLPVQYNKTYTPLTLMTTQTAGPFQELANVESISDTDMAAIQRDAGSPKSIEID